jgi:hypothetical protein
MGQAGPTVFPGAIRMYPENDKQFLTMAGFSVVRSYYAGEKNNPGTVEHHEGNGKTAFIVYVRQLPDDLGVHIYEKQGNCRTVNHIISRMQYLVVKGVLTEAEKDGIAAKYKYLEKYYFMHVEDEGGKIVPENEIIFRKYDRKLGAGGTGTMDNEAMINAQKLINSGRMQEGVELMKQAREEMISGIQVAGSRQAVELWIECLEEIASRAFPVRISFSM